MPRQSGEPPKYQEIADKLRRQIGDGTYPPGSLLPPSGRLPSWKGWLSARLVARSPFCGMRASLKRVLGKRLRAHVATYRSKCRAATLAVAVG